MTPLEVGLTVAGAVGMLFLAGWICYDEGQRSALRDIDGQLDVARILGAHGALMRLEAEALDVDFDEYVTDRLGIAAERYRDGGAS